MLDQDQRAGARPQGSGSGHQDPDRLLLAAASFSRRLPWRRPDVRPEPLARAAVVAELVRAELAGAGEVTWLGRGRSMHGSIADGEPVRLVAPRREDLVAGRVVMAILRDLDHLLVHRIVRVRGSGVVLRGDACLRADGLVPFDDVIAMADPNPARPRLGRLHRVLR